MPRSLLDVLIAARQPSSGSPMTSSSGTNTSSRKISPNPVSPPSWAIGRTVIPSACRSNMKYVRPLWRSASGSDRNSPNALSPNGRPRAPDLLPVEQPAAVGPASPSTAVMPGRCRTRAPTTPAPRSPRRWPFSAAPGPAAPRCRARTASAPASRCRWRWPARVRRPGSTPPRTPPSASSVASRPPYFSGQVITERPASKSTLSQRRCCSKPSAVSYDVVGNDFLLAARKSRTSARNSSVALVEFQIHYAISRSSGLDHLAARVARQRCRQNHDRPSVS